MTRRLRASKKGFTLIELLVVISIITFLVSVLLTSLNDSRKKAFEASLSESFFALRNNIALYYSEYSAYSYMCDQNPPTSTMIKDNLDSMADIFSAGTVFSNSLFYKCFNGAQQYVIYLKINDGDLRCLSSDNVGFWHRIKVADDQLNESSCIND